MVHIKRGKCMANTEVGNIGVKIKQVLVRDYFNALADADELPDGDEREQQLTLCRAYYADMLAKHDESVKYATSAMLMPR